MKSNPENKALEVDADLDKRYPVIVDTTDGIHESSTMLHYHDYIEICFLKQGTGVYVIGGRQYEFEEGDIFIIDSNEIHVAYEEKSIKIMVLLFKPDFIADGSKFVFDIEYLKPFWKFGKYLDNKLEKSNPYFSSILNVLMEIDRESKFKEEGFRWMIKSLLLKLSVLLTRYSSSRGAAAMPYKLKNLSRLRDIFIYIDENYSRKIKLEDLAKILNISITSFCTLFKNATGIPPMEYLIRMRIVKAMEVLIKTDRKITDIAESCGFNSMPHFISCFKKYTGRVPKDFKNNQI
ncbi:MAG: AraC family transcriptional regulator [Clostridia bacterium]|nr:AraC family transcriptional regulator [Clostridia bacterium]